LGVRTFEAHGPMDFHAAGHFELGRDGVMRSFGPGGNVLDYRQLSPEEVKERAKRDVNFLEKIGQPVSVGTRDLAANGADGRLVTRRDEVLQPSGRNLEKRGGTGKKKATCKRAESSPVERGIFTPLAKRNCPYPINCGCLTDCPRPQCNSCYFPNGPGNPGYCMNG
jgi:hypothetical protein